MRHMVEQVGAGALRPLIADRLEERHVLGLDELAVMDQPPDVFGVFGVFVRIGVLVSAFSTIA